MSAELVTIYFERTFDASHVLPDHPGKCSRLHGHTYRARVWLTGTPNPTTGMVVDFLELKRIVDEWDHAHLNDLVSFPPTVELLACELRRRILDVASSGSGATSTVGCVVRLSETPTSWAQAGGDPAEYDPVPEASNTYPADLPNDDQPPGDRQIGSLVP